MRRKGRRATVRFDQKPGLVTLALIKTLGPGFGTLASFKERKAC